MHEVTLLNKTFQFPSTWNELTTPELHLVAEAITGNFKTPEQAQAYIFLSILTLRCGGDKEARRAVKNLPPEEAFIQGTPAIQFILDGNTRTIQPHPVIKLNGTTYHGPADNFDSINVAEFENTEMHYMSFLQENDPIHLARLASEMWRPKDKKYTWLHNGEWQQYDAEALGMEAIFKQLPAYQLYSIFLWYAGCRETLPKIFPNCFSQGAASQETDWLVFTKCIHAAAGAKYGTIDKVRTMSLKELFLGLEEERKAAIAE